MDMSDAVISTPQSSDTLRHKKFNHTKNPVSMTPEEMLGEYVYLVSEYAGEKDKRYGVNMGLSEELRIRRDMLYSRIVYALGAIYTRAV